ncbi:recombinase family protein [Paraburkholderia caribensis]|uniref:Recombinase family protein n=1 Tax=Paraburkholderia caribensis TaxID=75105 RepID=A0A9Q6S120_9BURK|nr:recombinase family protein [Paraburkholderia caribensis]MCO4875775.1 recombinase family protein [Paraburkholderia caribensis]PTB28459.1 DNA invertase [Paraburkholderia caribensis]QLB62589.1 hypothetical protein A9O66_09465 [Paraburkholderia caribensis]
MSRNFAYCRVSTIGQHNENQIQEIAASGFVVEKKRIVEESISGSVAALQRPGFESLLKRMEEGDVLIVTKLDRLGRDAMDVGSTIDLLAKTGIKVVCIQLGGMDLTSAAGKLQMQVLTAVAEFERNLLIERTQAGLARAKAEGKAMGRPSALKESEQAEVLRRLAAGESVSQLARDYDTSRTTIQRVRDRGIEVNPAA